MNEQFRAKSPTIRAGIEALIHLYEDPTRWTKKFSARNAKGDLCAIEAGVCWCLMGGCYLVAPVHYSPLIDHLRRTVDSTDFGGMTIAGFNDDAQSIDVIRNLLERALETAHE